MKKMFEFVYKAYCKRTIKKLSKVACVFKSTDYEKYKKPGAKTYARFRPVQTFCAAMGFVYGKDWEKMLKVTGFQITEDETKIMVNIYTVRPGCIIGKKGSLVDELENVLKNAFGEKTEIDLHEVTLPIGLDHVNLI